MTTVTDRVGKKRFYCNNRHGNFEGDTLGEIKKQLKPFGHKHISGFGNQGFIIFDRELSFTHRGIRYCPSPKKPNP